jgi:hypothetical protein
MGNTRSTHHVPGWESQKLPDILTAICFILFVTGEVKGLPSRRLGKVLFLQNRRAQLRSKRRRLPVVERCTMTKAKSVAALSAAATR